jgi:4-hydroxythreonine-4-phosphate dehydrogenase
MNRLSKSTASKPVKPTVPLRLLITTGDPDGVGWEVTCKALNSIGPSKNVQFFIYRHDSSGPKLNRKFKCLKARSLAEASLHSFDPRTVIEINNGLAPARWVEEAAAACNKGTFQGMVTAPLSKTSIVRAGLHDIGHTEILERVSGIKPLFMGFIGAKFSVLLVTGHAPVKNAVASLNLNLMNKAVTAAKTLRLALSPVKQKLPLAFVGVNPHAGEDGLIGDEEGWMRGLIEDVRTRGERVIGPLVPDAAFLPKNWPLYSVYICPYHDQGLIPFKMVHGFKSGVHITLGLPFVRTSVDHGTAKDIHGRNKAEPGSMKDAVRTAIRLCRERGNL